VPTLAIVEGVAIGMFYFDHDPPHFHAVLGNLEMRVSIADLTVFSGRLPAAKRGAVLHWAARRQAELALCWVRCRSGEKPGRIAP
jgi:hypothetical protein